MVLQAGRPTYYVSISKALVNRPCISPQDLEVWLNPPTSLILHPSMALLDNLSTLAPGQYGHSTHR
jgi:hypothetical protein